MEKLERLRINVTGQVQGVGFRPYVWRLANENGLTGFCRNTSAGVEIEIQGAGAKARGFPALLRKNCPPLAKIASLSTQSAPILEHESAFSIHESLAHAGQNILVAPDVATCQDCLADVNDPQNPRYFYPFANCVNCGPRFSITRRLPYDRPNTVMACFPLCEACEKEYHDPANRRFHAQPIACSKCGPKIWFAVAGGDTTPPTQCDPEKALHEAVLLLREGGILALKGLGGFQLLCDAANEATVQRLRTLKNRPHKALAVMTETLANVETLAIAGQKQKELLAGRAKPIVLCEMKDANSGIARNVAPDCLYLGFMLPYTPLHALLFKKLRELVAAPMYLVATSGNRCGEPICLGNREAVAALGELCDGFLLHDRDILCRVDDSVAGVEENPWPKLEKNAQPSLERPFFIRRARGYVPEPIPSPFSTPQTVLGMGAELKATFSLSRKGNIFTSQHIGDMGSVATLDFYGEAIAHLSSLLEISPALLVHDSHPDFTTTSLAREMSQNLGIPAVPLQHHVAHAAAVLAENNVTDRALAVCLDGSGLGTDGRIWGCEFLLMEMDKASWERVGSCEPFHLPGGEKAILEPWRMARALDASWQPAAVSPRELLIIDEMTAKNINLPETSSCGRLFDAVSARLGLCEKITYEGQAAIRLEKAALLWLRQNPGKLPGELPAQANLAGEMPLLPARYLFQETASLFDESKDASLAAAFFHVNLASFIARMAVNLAHKYKTAKIGFSGGCLANQLLASRLAVLVANTGLTPLFHVSLPPGDGCVSCGQAIWGQALLLHGKI